MGLSKIKEVISNQGGQSFLNWDKSDICLDGGTLHSAYSVKSWIQFLPLHI